MAPTNQRSNRIEIDLKVLQDENVRKLEQFGVSFTNAVDVLFTAIGSLTGMTEGRPGDSGSYAGLQAVPAQQQAHVSGTLPAHLQQNILLNQASQAPTQVIPVTPVAGPGGPGGGPPTPPGAFPIPPRGTPASPAARSRGPWQWSFGEVNPNMTDYELAQFRLGALNPENPVSVLQYLSHITGNWATAGRDTNNNPIPKTGFWGGTISGGFSHATGGAARGITYGSNLFNTAAPRFGLPNLGQLLSPAGSIGLQQFGVNVGQSPNGGDMGFLQGVPVLGGIANVASPAGWTALAESAKAAWKTYFGTSGDITMAQSNDIRNTLANYGWLDKGAESQRNVLSSVLYKYTKKYRGLVTPEDMMNLGGDAAARFGTSSLKELNQVLDGLGPSARVAHMSLTEFKDALIASAQEVSKATGTPTTSAALGLESFTRATGLSPTIGANIASNKSNIWAGMALTGTHPWQLVEGKKSATTMALAGMTGKLAGSGLSDSKVWKQAQKEAAAGDPTKMHQLEDTMWRLYMIDPNLTGGMDPRQWKNQMLRGDLTHRVQGDMQLRKSNSEDSMIKAMKVAGATPAEISHFRHTVERERKDWTLHKGLKTFAEIQNEPKKKRDEDMKILQQFVKQERREAREILGTHERHTGDRVARRTEHVTFDLTPDARRLLRQLHGPVSQSNSALGFDRSSSSKHPADVLPKRTSR